MSSESVSPEQTPLDASSHELSPLEQAESKIAQLETSLKEEKNKHLYLYAEFDNFKKRNVKERSDLIKFGWENIARDILDVVDNLERAVEYIPPTTDANLKAGIEMTITQFRNVLEKQGVALIKSDGVTFNPELHEAMSQEPSALPSGTITATLVKGYTLNGRLLRPAKVVVSSGQPD